MSSKEADTGLDISWQESAACDGMNPNIFFPDDASLSAEKRSNYEDMAKAICRRCVVRDDCLDYAIARSEQYGIWGGMTAKERNKLPRRGYIRNAS